MQDLLSITLSTTKEGVDASGVQNQLRQALDAALAEARKAARPKLLEVRTGAFSIAPRYATKPGSSGNTISGWQGHAELVIEGSDTAAISQLAGRLGTLTVARVAFGLSREAHERTEAEVAAQAIARFKGRAESYARQFGFGGYSLREVTVGSGDLTPPAQNYRVRALTASGSDESQPIEAGKSVVTVNVSGSIELSPR
jgi:predicted secreted protein